MPRQAVCPRPGNGPAQISRPAKRTLHNWWPLMGSGYAQLSEAPNWGRTALEASTDVTVRLPRRLGTDGSQTHRWREQDSNHRSRGDAPDASCAGSLARRLFRSAGN